MIVGIVGSRRRASASDYTKLLHTLHKLEEKHHKITKVVTGDCESGGDDFARIYAEDEGKKLDVKYKMKDGKRWINSKVSGNVNYWKFTQMCYDRNKGVAREKMDFLVCLVAKDRTGGTENTIKYFKKYQPMWERRLILI